jgi:glyoxylase-like metal-dependent hydrolase (beta-lactamase superfamily II)
MIVQRFVCNAFQENTYICHENGEAVLIDPGASSPNEFKRIWDYLATHALSIRHILLTHGHIDHIIGLKAFCERYELGYQMHEADEPLVEAVERTAQKYGMSVDKPDAPMAYLDENDAISFGNTTWQIFHTPGHSPGSICFYDAKNGFVISGDVLFARSIGRTDLWQGSTEVLMHSIETKLLPLPDNTVVWSGHGRETTILAEKQMNPFLRK